MWLSWDCFGFWLADSPFQIPAWQEWKRHWEWGKVKGPSKYKEGWRYMQRHRNPQHWWTPSSRGRTRSAHSEWAGEESGGGSKVGERWGGHQHHLQPGLCPDGCGSWANYVGWGGASQEEALTYHGRQGSLERIPWTGKVKKPWRYQPRTVVLHEIYCFQKSVDLLIHKLPFSCLVHEITLEVGKYDMHFQACVPYWLCWKL